MNDVYVTSEEKPQVNTVDDKPVTVEKPRTKKDDIRENFGYFGIASLIYAIVYTVCLYKNLHGLGTTILMMATFVYAYLMLKKLGYTFARKHVGYAVIGGLLAFNLMYTMDGWVLFVDYVAIIMVFVTGVLSVIYDNSELSFGESIMAVLEHIFGSLENVFACVNDWRDYRKDGKTENNVYRSVFIGIIISIPALILILLLLSSADIVFGDITERIFGEIKLNTTIVIGLMFAGSLSGSYAWLIHFVDKDKSVHKDKRNGDPTILITVGLIISAVYLFFCGIQVVYLFAGLGELPNNYTYAEYAREGFFQLLAVCILNLLFVLMGLRLFKEKTLLKVVLTVITGCTYIMIASSAYRMALYIDVYSLSLLRIWVLWTLLWLTVILTGALINIYKNGFSLFKYSMVVTSFLYLSFAYAKPAYLVAGYNLNDDLYTGPVDQEYLADDLNEDAMPVIYRYIDDEDYMNRYIESCDRDYRHEEKDYSFRQFNISRAIYEHYKNEL